MREPVLIEWIDANSIDAWVEIADLERHLPVESMYHQSVGWIMVDSPERIILAASRAEAGDKVGEVITIPRVAIRATYSLTRTGNAKS
jgi:hypothetical protein